MSQFLIKSFFYTIAPIYRQFIRDLAQPNVAQNKVKNRVIQRLAKTAYGSTLKVRNLDDWQQIPIVDYDAIEPWITQQRQQPSASILTPEKIHFWECTSGSTGPKKWIPYTTSLLGSFSKMFCIWANDLNRDRPGFSTYKSYLCISPDIGTDIQGRDDLAYVHPYLRWVLDRFIVRVQGSFPTVDEFRWTLALALLETADLEIFSLWSPSFLTTQLDFIQAHRQVLQNALKNKMSSNRLKLLAEPDIPWSQIWPELKLISCWDRQDAADRAKGLQQYFPEVFIQGKGLLATEAPMTIPLIPAAGFVPLVNQVVLEFLDPQGQVRDLTELEFGVTYELVISQLGGLSRYKIGDRVEVSHWYFNTPCLNFVGRGDEVSDLVGEKLTVGFVTECLNQLGYLEWGFCCLVPVLNDIPHYCLLLEQSPETPETITRQLEEVLQTNVHYHRARQFGQLGSLEAIVHKDAIQCFQRGKRLGDAKYPILAIEPFKGEIWERNPDLQR